MSGLGQPVRRVREPRSIVVWFGAGLLALGVLSFVVLPLSGSYRLTRDGLATALDSLSLAEPRHRALMEAMGPGVDQRLGHPVAFASLVNTAVLAANEHLPREHIMWDYDRGQVVAHLTRAALEVPYAGHLGLVFLATLGSMCLGGVLIFLPRLWRTYPGIKNDDVTRSGAMSRGAVGIAIGAMLIGFYLALYFAPHWIVAWIQLADPVSLALRRAPADRWFFYGLLYTLATGVMAVRMAIHYRHSRYHLVRTASLTFFQMGFAFLIPAVLSALNLRSYDFKLAWPLDYSFFYGYNLDGLMASGPMGWFILCWGVGLSFLGVPLLAVFFGKRWYCSWVCGCGGLAETVGDPWRHLSDKRLVAWRIERYSVHGVLVAVVLMTAMVLANYFSQGAWFGDTTWRVQEWYGFFIGSLFAGVVGTGFYPLMGNRVWCRFGCPLAAILGLVQRFRSRFRITTNGAQCISCGNCSKYCEQGIDVRSYAQRGQNIVRASCVGCGVCASVCPRGVLRLENGPMDSRINHHSLVQLGRGPL